MLFNIASSNSLAGTPAVALAARATNFAFGLNSRSGDNLRDSFPPVKKRLAANAPANADTSANHSAPAGYRKMSVKKEMSSAAERATAKDTRRDIYE
jgi:hypothetical protein